MLLILDLDSAYRHITPRENKVLGIDEIIEKWSKRKWMHIAMDDT